MLAQFNVLLAMYVVPLVWTYLVLRKFYKQEKKKKYPAEEPSPADLFFIFCPLVNIVVGFVTSMILICRFISAKNSDGKSAMTKFFKL